MTTLQVVSPDQWAAARDELRIREAEEAEARAAAAHQRGVRISCIYPCRLDSGLTGHRGSFRGRHWKGF